MSRAADLGALSVEETNLMRLFRAVDPGVREDIVARVLGAPESRVVAGEEPVDNGRAGSRRGD